MVILPMDIQKDIPHLFHLDRRYHLAIDLCNTAALRDLTAEDDLIIIRLDIQFCQLLSLRVPGDAKDSLDQGFLSGIPQHVF